MIKTETLQKLIEIAKHELKALESALNNVKAGVNSPESKQEGKYDTRALLDSYLAGGQEARIKQLKSEIQFAERSITNDSFARIFKLTDHHSKNLKLYLVAPCLGGYTLNLNIGKVQTITTKTPLAITLADKEVDDAFDDGALAGYVIREIL